MDMSTINRATIPTNVGNVERMLSLATGAGLIVYALGHSGRERLPLLAGASYLLYRGATGHCMAYKKLEINRAQENGHHGIQVQRSITINRPRNEVYRLWRNLEGLPRFTQHLQDVEVGQPTNGQQSRWVAKAPMGQEIMWEAEIVEERENELIRWQSLPGSTIETTGYVEFKDAPGNRGTEVYVSFEYHAPGGSFGAAIAKLFGEEPAQQVRDDLRRFKQFLESGVVATTEGQPSGRSETAKKLSSPPEMLRKDLVERAAEGSFPASDPPAWTPG